MLFTTAFFFVFFVQAYQVIIRHVVEIVKHLVLFDPLSRRVKFLFKQILGLPLICIFFIPLFLMSL